MEFKYKFILKKIVCNKLRNIYIRVNSKSRKQYLKYKGEMINIKEYKSNFKNINKKIYKYKKIKGGGNEFETFIDDINKIIFHLPDAPASMSDAPAAMSDASAAMSDAPEKPDPLSQFHKAYLKCVENWKKEEENLKFLTKLLTYLEENFKKLETDEERGDYILLLNKLSTLLFVLDQQAITGIHSYNKDPNSTAYVYNKPKYFDEIIEVINKFRDEHKKIAWTKFKHHDIKYILDKKNIKKEEITISNSAVKELIDKMISNKGLDTYDPNHKTLSSISKSARSKSAISKSAISKSAISKSARSELDKPYSRPYSAISKNKSRIPY